MITAFPDYYNEFRCIASRCRHSCCVGWEIDIDPASAGRYAAMNGPLGDSLREHICWEGQPHFILGEDERCPLLREDGLCRLILECGEDSLCRICADHPRFRNCFGERTETGLGLCCEEAARLVLSRERPFSLVEEGQGEYSADEDALMDLREEIFEIIHSSGRPLTERMDSALKICGGELTPRDMSGWAPVFLELERLDENWTLALERLRYAPPEERAVSELINRREREFRNLFDYFIFRHLFSALEDGAVGARIAFAVLGVRMVAAMAIAGGGTDFGAIAELARMFSGEIEYSDENLYLLFDALV